MVPKATETRAKRFAENRNPVPQIPPDPFAESVYGLLAPSKPPNAPWKLPFYHSIHRQQVLQETDRSKKQANKTMGPLQVEKKVPSDFLRKRDRDRRPALVPTTHRNRELERRREPLPTTQKKLLRKAWPTDWVNKNAVDMTNKAPPAVAPTKEPYVRKSCYGSTPQYIKNLQKSKESTPVALVDPEEQKLSQAGLAKMRPGEREQILEKLKQNWAKLNMEYQRFSLVVDTAPKIARKLQIENKLKEIETNIERFSHEHVYIDLKA